MGRIESPKPVTMHRFFGDEKPRTFFAAIPG